MPKANKKITTLNFAFTLEIEPNEKMKLIKTKQSRGNTDEIRAQMVKIILDATDDVSVNTALYWNSFYTRDVYRCEQYKHFHTAAKVFEFNGKPTCRECIEGIFKQEDKVAEIGETEIGEAE